MEHSIQNRYTLNTTFGPETGAFILRIALGTVLLAHSVYLKLMVFTLPGTAQFFGSIGLPGFLAYVVFAVEAVAGIALLLGIRTRLFAVMVIPVMLGATWAHASSGWLFSNEGGGWEYPLILTVMALAQAALGGGAWSVSSRD